MNAWRQHATPLPRIARFALLSLIVHAALLLAWQHPELFAGQRDSILSVMLTDAAQTPAPALVSAIPRPAQRQQEPRLIQPVHTNAVSGIHQSEANAVVSETASETASGADGPGISLESARVHLQARLLTDLARHFNYPDMARRRGWEGTVLLGLRVESNGHLEKIRIEHSSGYAVLDNSALNSLNRLGQLAEASAWLNGRGLDMQLPVIYRLIEN